MSQSESTYLGLDVSTQQLKGVIVNEKLEILHESVVQYDSVLPEFRTHSGVVKSDKQTVLAPVLMWVKALDLLLDKLRVCGADFSQVAALSGSAQQHGTVYWQIGAEKLLMTLDPDSFLHTQLASAFSVTSSPIWMDSSTSSQCKQFEEAVGGPQKLAEITGSRAYERYSAAQIMKIAQTKPGAYTNTERISLVSSFACSLFLGKYAPIDWSDGSGMNLLNIHTKTWSSICLQACAEDLESRLGQPVPSHTEVGTVSDYMMERHGFDSSCKVIAFTGDNPSSLAGMQLRAGDIAISLGTSDTLFLSINQPVVLSEGHILVNPINNTGYMVLLCFKNGSLSRERIRDSVANGSWDQFNKLLNSTPRGNFGNFGLFYDTQEIIPFVQGDFRWDRADNAVSKFNNETEVRALVEGQFVAKRSHAEDFGYSPEKNTRVLATGGGSNNKYMLQVLADCFNAKVYTLESANSAVLGAAYRAKHGLLCSSGLSFGEVIVCLPTPTLTSQPYADADQLKIFLGPVIHSVQREEVTVIERAAILVEDGKITKISTLYDDSDIKSEYPSAKIIELKYGQFLIPGFIDTHIHACQVPNAGLGYDKPLLDWLNSYTFALESRYKDAEFSKQVYKSVVERTLSCGSTTTVYFGTIHRLSCKVLAETVHQAGQRAWVGKVNMDRNTTIDLTEETDASVRETARFIEDVNDLRSELVRPIIMPRFAITCSAELMKHLASLALQHDLLIETHMSENKEEIKEVKKLFSSSYAEVYNNTQLLSKKTILAHCVHLEEREISLLHEKKASVSHCPNSNLCLQSGMCDVRKLLEANINVSLGTDVAGGCNPSILDAIRSALNTSISLSFSKLNYKPLTYHEAFYLATMGGAIALNEEKNLGNFSVGKYFDAIIVDTANPNSPFDTFTTLTLSELFQKFIYTGDDRNIYKVFVHGKLVHTKT